MKTGLGIFCLILITTIGCRKQVEKDRPEFIGYWSGGSYMEYGWTYIKIESSSRAEVYAYDHENEHEYYRHGKARADDEKLTIGGIKYFKIIEYPHPLDTTIVKHYVINHLDNSYKLATWIMVLEGMKGFIGLDLGTRTYYKADY